MNDVTNLATEIKSKMTPEEEAIAVKARQKMEAEDNAPRHVVDAPVTEEARQAAIKAVLEEIEKGSK